jgi:AcrR family transcriptional regulator
MPKRRRPQPLRFRRKTHALRAREITGAAADLLCKVGCQGLRVDHVAAECGVAKGTCYQHFHSRTELVATVVRDLDKALASLVLSVEGSIPDPRERLRSALLTAVDAKLALLARAGTARAGPLSEQPPVWPCCMKIVPCPYGGASGTTAALERLAERLPHMEGQWSVALVAVLLALPQALALRHASHLPTPAAIRAIAAELFDRLVGRDASETKA